MLLLVLFLLSFSFFVSVLHAFWTGWCCWSSMLISFALVFHFFYLVFSFVKFASNIYVYICFYLLSVIKIYRFCIYIDFLNILNFFLKILYSARAVFVIWAVILIHTFYFPVKLYTLFASHFYNLLQPRNKYINLNKNVFPAKCCL